MTDDPLAAFPKRAEAEAMARKAREELLARTQMPQLEEDILRRYALQHRAGELAARAYVRIAQLENTRLVASDIAMALPDGSSRELITQIARELVDCGLAERYGHNGVVHFRAVLPRMYTGERRVGDILR